MLISKNYVCHEEGSVKQEKWKQKQKQQQQQQQKQNAILFITKNYCPLPYAQRYTVTRIHPQIMCNKSYVFSSKLCQLAAVNYLTLVTKKFRID